jgi:hypothetical protein
VISDGPGGGLEVIWQFIWNLPWLSSYPPPILSFSHSSSQFPTFVFPFVCALSNYHCFPFIKCPYSNPPIIWYKWLYLLLKNLPIFRRKLLRCRPWWPTSSKLALQLLQCLF